MLNSRGFNKEKKVFLVRASFLMVKYLDRITVFQETLVTTRLCRPVT